ncbi:MAG: AAA family ATPase [Spirulinaceae cyanobacterium]
MINVPGYKILSQIHESTNSLVFRGIREQDRQPIILKVLKQNYPTPEEIRRYQQEYTILRNLEIEGVVTAYSLEKYRHTLVIILEDFGGESLQILAKEKPLALDDFLLIASKIVTILGQVHAAKIIHKDINPSNIVFNPTTGKLKLIDFGISTVFAQENSPSTNPLILEGTLAYISPEQTGRMNRYLDYRSDFYSLGVSFYELLSGSLPFKSKDPLELVHCHIAKTALPLGNSEREIPQVVADIVMKLMAKNAEDRYQSAWGIKTDLEECLLQLQTTEQISLFPLGTQDITDKFQIPQKMYGREKEVRQLLEAFEIFSPRNEEKGRWGEEENKFNSKLILVTGSAGIGKSTLIASLYEPITAKRGYFITGKFDHYQQNLPYFGIIQAFRGLIKHLLAETETQLNQWREKIQTALGINGRVISEVIPEVELLIGSQPDIPNLAPAEAQNRFNLVFQKFSQVFAQREHPLVLFLDDLQWADQASMQLIKLLINATNLFVIGAYRDCEVKETNFINLMIEEINQNEVVVKKIALQPLKLKQVTQLIVDTFNSDAKRVASLAQLVLIHTNGNPFFINVFLHSLYQEGLFHFQYPQVNFNHQWGWQWDLKRIQEWGFTDNVVELMAGKIQNFVTSTQQILKLAACLGNRFKLQTLATVAEKSPEEIILSLQEAIAQRLITALQKEYPNSEPEVEYKFSHDRLQQAVYSLIPPQERKFTHWQIGQLWYSSLSEEKRQEHLFAIVNQMNEGVKFLPGEQTKQELIKLNLQAGKRAKAANAYQTAVRYFDVALSLLPPDSWQTNYQLTLDLSVEAVEAQYLNTNFPEAEKLAQEVLSQGKTVLDKIKVYQTQIQFYGAQNQMEAAINTALHALEMLDITLLASPPSQEIVIEDLYKLPTMTQADKLAALRILMLVFAPAFIAKPALLSPIAFTMVDLCIKYGNSPLAAYAYTFYGFLLCGVMGQIPQGYQFGQLGLQLSNNFEAREVQCKVHNLFNAHIRHWREPARAALQPLHRTIEIGLETGDIEFAAYAALPSCSNPFFIGEPLISVQRQQGELIPLIANLKQQFQLHYAQIWGQIVLNLRGETPNPCLLVGEIFDEATMLPQLQASNNLSSLFCIYLAKTILNYLFQDFEAAVTNATLTEQYAPAMVGLLALGEHKFYYSLALLGRYPQVESSLQKDYLQQVAINQAQMKTWADNAPTNFQHKYLLVEAEKARILRQKWSATEFYDQAIKQAKNSENIPQEALAYELAAQFYLSCDRQEIAQLYMKKAHYHYLRWQATAKVEDIVQRHSSLLEKFPEQKEDQHNNTSSSSSGEALDLTAIIKANQAISQEIKLDKLLATLMKILLENAGATKGCLILPSGDGSLLIEAQGTVDSESISVLESLPLGIRLPVSIINYVVRSQETVVYNNLQQEKLSVNDPYLQKQQPQSLLCVPITNQGKLVFLVYLENTLTTGAFTAERLQLLTILSSQAAISIKNAQLYTEVQASKSKLTQFLEAIPVGVFVLDAKAQPYYANSAAQQILGKGITKNDNIETLADIYDTYIAGTNQKYPTEQLPVIRALRGESSTINNIEIHQKDKVVPLEVWGTPVYNAQGQVIYGIAAFQDITERKTSEAEVAKFTAGLLRLNEACSRFVPRQFLTLLGKESIADVQLGDCVHQEMSVLFADIRNFTTLSEAMTPEDNFKFINAYLSRMEPSIIENHGFIDKYIGDAIMALFRKEADDAVKAAIAMLQTLSTYNQTRQGPLRPPIKIGIGINTGSLMLGTVGGKSRLDSTAISDAVNLAARLEDLTKRYEVSLLISHHTLARLQDPTQYHIRLIAQIVPKGKSRPVAVFEVFDGDPPEIRAAKSDTIQFFEEALQLFYRHSHSQAAKLFQQCLRLNPDDKVAQIYLERCGM